jgi:hypothetical protein
MKLEITRLSDVEAQLQTQRNRNAQIDEQKAQLQSDQLTASDYILELEHKLYKANKTSLELIRLLKEAETEIENMQKEIVDLKQRFALYIPVKDDPVDRRLAEFINNYPDRQRLRIMFYRESEGVYQFGTKRVNIRVENNKINVRVGGGYLSIDEFLEQYTPTELEKLARQDPLKKVVVYFMQRLPTITPKDNQPLDVTPSSVSPRNSIVNSSSSPKFGAS